MQFDVDAFYQQVEPWDLTLNIDGLLHRVRPLSNADMLRLQRAGSMGEEQGYALVAGLFEPPAPAVRDWDSEKAALVLGAIVTYAGERLKKKCRKATEEMRRQMSAGKSSS